MNNNSGIGLTGVLAVVFIVLKLVGVIHWSWLWVISPLWIPLAIGLVVLGTLMLIKCLLE